MNRLGIDLLSTFGMPPVEYVHLAADLGCAHICTGFQDMSSGLGATDDSFNPHHYPHWSVRDDPVLKRDMAAAMRDREISIALVEGFIIRPDFDVSSYAEDLDMVAEFDGRRINCVSMDPDRSRTLDQIARLAEMAEQVEVKLLLEFAPILATRNLDEALAAIRHCGRANAGLLIDTLHFVRGGSTAADLAALDPALIGYIQLSDAPLAFELEKYQDEAVFARLPPGSGELPLVDILSAAPRDVPIGLEVPQRALARAGVSPYDRLKVCVDGARAILAQVD